MGGDAAGLWVFSEHMEWSVEKEPRAVAKALGLRHQEKVVSCARMEKPMGGVVLEKRGLEHVSFAVST